MIDYIKGRLTYVDTAYVVVEAHGVGYQLLVGNPFNFNQRLQEEVCIYTYQHVREDAILLFGFSTREERLLFEKLLLVSGIGPKLASGILATAIPAQLIRSIQTDDLAYLTTLPGVGKKTAQRIILDLKDKLADVRASFSEEYSLTTTGSSPGTSFDKQQTNSVLAELKEALHTLGYSDREVQQILPQIQAESEQGWGIDQLLKLSLQLLAK